MPDIHYIPLHCYITRVKEARNRGELQLDGKSELAASPELTSLRVHSVNTGDPVTGEAVLNLEQLKELRDALNARIGDLEGTSGRDSLDDVGDIELRERIRNALGDLTFSAPAAPDFVERQVARAKHHLTGQ